MRDLDQRYNTCADIRIQMLGSDGAAFAVGKPASDALEADSASAEFHAHVYLEDGSGRYASSTPRSHASRRSQPSRRQSATRC